MSLLKSWVGRLLKCFRTSKLIEYKNPTWIYFSNTKFTKNDSYNIQLYWDERSLLDDWVRAGCMDSRDEFDIIRLNNGNWRIRINPTLLFTDPTVKLTMIVSHKFRTIATVDNIGVIKNG